MNDFSNLITDLDSPVRSFRLFALEEILRLGNTAELLKALEERKRVESDQELGLLIEFGIRTLKKRLKSAEVGKSLEKPDEFLETYFNSEICDRLDMLGQVTPVSASRLAFLAPELLGKEKHDLLRSQIIRAFGRFWPKGDQKNLSRLIASKHYATRVATLEAFIFLAPEALKRDLPKLLSNDDHRLRAIAVKGLAKIDEDEAVNHLINLLFSDSKKGKITALRSVIFFPVAKILPVLLKFLSFESESGLVARVCLFLENNPDNQFPFQLWEISQSATAEKKKIILESLEKILNNLEISFNNPQDYDEFVNRFDQWKRERLTIRWVSKLLQSIQNQAAKISEFDAYVNQRFNDPMLLKILKKTLEDPWIDEIQERIEFWISSLDPSPAVQKGSPQERPSGACADIPEPVSESAVPELGSFKSLGEEEQIRKIAFLEQEDLEAFNPIIDEILKSEDESDLVATALRTAARLDLPQYGEVARKSLNKGNLNLVAGSMEYLGKFDPEWIFPHIGKYLHSKNVRLRSIALKTLQNHDPNQALDLLKSLLYSMKQDNKKLGLACLIHFEFSLIRDILYKFMVDTPQFDLSETALFLFRSNPAIENLPILFELEKTLPEKIGKVARSIRQDNLEVLKEMGLVGERVTMESLDGSLRKKIDAEKKKQKEASPPYSVEKLRNKNLLGKAVGWVKDIFQTPRG